MTVAAMIREQLEALGLQTDFSSGSHMMQAEEGPTRVTCDLTALGSLGCAFRHLTVESLSLADASSDRVQKISKTLAKKLTYLLEPISPIEIDHDGCVVQLRSDPPHRVEDSRSYYELLVQRGGQISLRRYIKSNGTVREETPASVTHEVFLRLVDDMLDAID